jgi:hypothetical protein
MTAPAPRGRRARTRTLLFIAVLRENRSFLADPQPALRTAAKGHKEQFLPPRMSGGCGLG